MHAQSLYLLLFSLYWAQGLPVGFMTHALPVILRAEGVSLAHIGGFGLLMLPWSIKIFWAPWVDRCSGRWGAYRSWIIPTQLLSVLVLVILSFFPISALDQPGYLLAFFISLLLLNLLGATQDIATDGLAVRLLGQQQQHWGNSFQVIGSRLGFIVGGGLLLWGLDWLSWQITFLSLASLVLLNTLPILILKSAQAVSLNPHTTSDSKPWTQLYHDLRHYWQDPVFKVWLGVLLSFKVADGLAGPVLKPLMVDLGLSFSQIGLYITMLGAGAALVGAGMAGFCLKWLSRAQALLLFSILKIASLAAYVWLAWQYEQSRPVAHALIYAINAVEDLLSAMLLMVMLTLVMQVCRPQFAATDFTFQVALMATVSGILYGIGGILAEILGYATTLEVIILLAVLCLWPIVRWQSRITKPIL